MRGETDFNAIIFSTNIKMRKQTISDGAVTKHLKGKTNRVLKKTFNSIGILIVWYYMNNKIETNQIYQKFKEILTARHY